MAERDKELQLLEKRFAELADRAWQQNLFVFTGFLSLAEQEVLWRSAAKAGVHIELYGGMDGAERCMGRFGDPEEFGYEEPFPICAVKIEPLAEKFAENFSHRDFMGAILNLGIDRSTIGDLCGGQMRVCVLYVCDVCIFTGNSRTGAPYKGALRAGRKAGGAAGEKTFLPGRACGEPALRRNCERGLETVAQPGADAFFTEKGLCQREVNGKRQPDVKGRGHGIGQRFRKIYFPG